MTFSLKIWERIKALGVVDIILDTIDKWHERGVVLYKTDWSTNRIESLVTYLKRQMPSTYAEALAGEHRDLMASFDEDHIALLWLRWIINNITYKTDFKKFGVLEKWENIDHVLATREGDCESGASLLYVLCRLSGIPRNRLRLYGGWVEDSKGKQITINGKIYIASGHVWLQYRCYRDGRWRTLDWCYDTNTRPIAERPWAYSKPRYLDRWWGFCEEKHYKGWR